MTPFPPPLHHQHQAPPFARLLLTTQTNSTTQQPPHTKSGSLAHSPGESLRHTPALWQSFIQLLLPASITICPEAMASSVPLAGSRLPDSFPTIGDLVPSELDFPTSQLRDSPPPKCCPARRRKPPLRPWLSRGTLFDQSSCARL